MLPRLGVALGASNMYAQARLLSISINLRRNVIA